jgi:hypothetical protein
VKGSWPQDAVFDALGKVKLKPSDDVTGPPFSELECICFGNMESPSRPRSCISQDFNIFP